MGVVGVVVTVTSPCLTVVQPATGVSIRVAVTPPGFPDATTPTLPAAVAVPVTAPPRILKVVSIVLETFETLMPVVAGAAPSMVTRSKSTVLAL